jgi:hypothetical protein
VLPLTLALRTVQELVSGQTALDKVLAVSISSMSPSSSRMLTFGIKAHAGLDLVVDTTSH